VQSEAAVEVFAAIVQREGGVCRDSSTQAGTRLSFEHTRLGPGMKGSANEVTYAIYIMGGSQIDLGVELSKGTYRAEWVNTKTGKVDKREEVKPLGRDFVLSSPRYTDDIALRIVRSTNK
jgi:hypothetical protein